MYKTITKMVQTLFAGHLLYNDIIIFGGPMHDYISLYNSCQHKMLWRVEYNHTLINYGILIEYMKILINYFFISFIVRTQHKRQTNVGKECL